jgi:RNA polymerase sigma factor (sigma-70 family)
MSVESVAELWRARTASIARADPGPADPALLAVGQVRGRSGGVGLPQNVEQSDLVSYGIFGLIDAIEKFDPDRGFKFETYAISRIKGAILDELRSIDWVPRSVRAKGRAVERAFSKLEATPQAVAHRGGAGHRAGLHEAQLQQILGQLSLTGIAALDEMLGDRADAPPSATPSPIRPTAPGRWLELREMRTPPGRGHRADARAGEDRPHALLLRELHAGSQIGQVLGHREPSEPDPHQGRPPAPQPPAGRQPRTSLRPRDGPRAWVGR